MEFSQRVCVCGEEGKEVGGEGVWDMLPCI